MHTSKHLDQAIQKIITQLPSTDEHEEYQNRLSLFSIVQQFQQCSLVAQYKQAWTFRKRSQNGDVAAN